ncbi:MAG: FMN-binding protein [Anaerotignum sp.]|nr:FMN-binding protein [Anaerotignum sp.]
MLLLFNVTLAWISVGLMVTLSIIYLLRIANKHFFNNQNETLKKWNRRLRKHHKWMGILVVITGLLHGILSSFSVLSFNMGTMLLVVFILLALSFMFRKIFSKGWMKLHRLLTGLAFVLLVLHLVEVGGFVGVDGIKTALQHDALLKSSSVSQGKAEAEITDTITQDSQETASGEAFLQKEDTTNSSNTVTDETASTPKDTIPEAVSDNSGGTEDTTSGSYIDGTYTGTADGYGPGLTVEVVIENGYIASVEVVAHNEKNERFYGEPVEVIPTEIVAAQSTDVDIITGATFTSNGIKNAVNNALANALK